MAVVHNQFKDVKPGGRATYTWPINHDQEDERARDRAVDSSANVAGTRTIQSQGDLSPFELSFQGSALTDEQVAEFWQWVAVCEDRTIRLIDFMGHEYEVIITAFRPKPVRVALNTRQPTKPWKWEYRLNMTVISVKSGPLYGIPA